MIYYITIFVFKCYGILWTVVNDLNAEFLAKANKEKTLEEKDVADDGES